METRNSLLLLDEQHYMAISQIWLSRLSPTIFFPFSVKFLIKDTILQEINLLELFLNELCENGTGTEESKQKLMLFATDLESRTEIYLVNVWVSSFIISFLIIVQSNYNVSTVQFRNLNCVRETFTNERPWAQAKTRLTVCSPISEFCPWIEWHNTHRLWCGKVAECRVGNNIDLQMIHYQLGLALKLKGSWW